MRMHFFRHRFLALESRAQQVLLAMRFATGLGWGMAVGLALGFVLSWGMLHRFAMPASMLWRAQVVKTKPTAPSMQTVAKAQPQR